MSRREPEQFHLQFDPPPQLAVPDEPPPPELIVDPLERAALRACQVGAALAALDSGDVEKAKQILRSAGDEEIVMNLPEAVRGMWEPKLRAAK